MGLTDPSTPGRPRKQAAFFLLEPNSDMQAKGGKFLHQINGDLYTRGCHATANCIGAGQINPFFFDDVVAGNDNGTGTLGPGYDMVTGMTVANGKSMGGLYGIPTP